MNKVDEKIIIKNSSSELSEIDIGSEKIMKRKITVTVSSLNEFEADDELSPTINNATDRPIINDTILDDIIPSIDSPFNEFSSSSYSCTNQNINESMTEDQTEKEIIMESKIKEENESLPVHTKIVKTNNGIEQALDKEINDESFTTSSGEVFSRDSMLKAKSRLTSLSYDNIPGEIPLPSIPNDFSKKDWLLRLFESEFFSPHIAISYICQYGDSPGIQNYLCDRLWSYPQFNKVAFYLPQLCHIALFGFETSTNEEFICVFYFLMKVARRCRHSAMVIIWCLENHWNENPSNIRINYLLQQIQAAVFGPKHINKNYNLIYTCPSLDVSMIGFSTMLAGSILFPKFVEKMKPLILLQTGILEPYDILFQEIPQTNYRKGSVISMPNLHRRESNQCLSASPSVEELHQGKAFGKTLKHFISSIKHKSTSKSSESSLNSTMQHVFLYTSEMQFVMSLIEISKRMCQVEKKSRNRTLAAELNIINSSLPANICIPLWCDAQSEHHDIILRIAQDEASTLNSAERVPLLLFIEILSNEYNCFEDLEDLVKFKNSVNTSFSPLSTNGPSETTASQLGSEFSDDKSSINIASSVKDDEYSERLRSAAIMLAQLSRQAANPKADKASIENIRKRLIVEMELIERQKQEIRNKSQADVNLGYLIDPSHSNKIREDFSAVALSEDWELKTSRIRANSPFGHLEGWKLVSVIAKSGSDMRQEHLACQLISIMSDIWERDDLDLWVRPLKILVTGEGGGLVETVPNSLSLHSIRKRGLQEKKGTGIFTLKDHFIKSFGPIDSPDYLYAVNGFISSLAAYSLVTYVLSLKDRHNGNILLDSQGHLVHIDFGFMLGNAPGGNYVTFETAPFKLTFEYLDLLSTVPGAFDHFKQLFLQGFLALRKSFELLELPIKILQKNSKLPALEDSTYGVEQLRYRLYLGLSGRDVEVMVERLISSSSQNSFTRLYDTYQYYSNGIL